MLDRKAWESSIGCVYRTRGGKELVRIKGVPPLAEELVIIGVLENGFEYPFDATGICIDVRLGKLTAYNLDLMEMVRTSNMPKSSGQSCG